MVLKLNRLAASTSRQKGLNPTVVVLKLHGYLDDPACPARLNPTVVVLKQSKKWHLTPCYPGSQSNRSGFETTAPDSSRQAAPRLNPTVVVLKPPLQILPRRLA